MEVKMSNYNEELIGRFCLYRRGDESVYHIAMPYAPHPGIPDQNRLSVIFLDTNAPYRKEQNRESIKIDHGVDPDSLFPIDISTTRGRVLTEGLLTNLADMVAAFHKEQRAEIQDTKR